MSDDEVFVMILCIPIGAYLWIRWLLPAFTVRRAQALHAAGWFLIMAPLICVVLLLLLLKSFASFDVRDDMKYLAFYLIMGVAWLAIWLHLFHFLGLIARDDVFERNNSAAAITIGGLMLSLTFAFAGGNFGDGPGWWVVVFCSGIATASLCVLWLVLVRVSGVLDEILIDRDSAAAWRTAGFMVACGAVLGRAVAGNWISSQATLRDFSLFAWPVLVILLAAVLFEAALPARVEAGPTDKLVTAGLPVMGYIAMAVGILVQHGWW